MNLGLTRFCFSRCSSPRFPRLLCLPVSSTRLTCFELVCTRVVRQQRKAKQSKAEQKREPSRAARASIGVIPFSRRAGSTVGDEASYRLSIAIADSLLGVFVLLTRKFFRWPLFFLCRLLRCFAAAPLFPSLSPSQPHSCAATRIVSSVPSPARALVALVVALVRLVSPRPRHPLARLRSTPSSPIRRSHVERARGENQGCNVRIEKEESECGILACLLWRFSYAFCSVRVPSALLPLPPLLCVQCAVRQQHVGHLRSKVIL